MSEAQDKSIDGAGTLTYKEAVELLQAPPEWRAFLNKILNYNRDRVMKMTDKESFVLQRTDGEPPVTIHRRDIKKIGVKEWNAIRKQEAALEDLPYGFGAKSRAAEIAAEIGLQKAKAFLGMDEGVYYALAWEEIKDLLDLLSWETLNGRPLSSKT